MNVIDTMLQSEYSKICRSISRLEDECSQRPKGSLARKKRGTTHYIYIVRRVAGKVVTEYIGKEGSWKAKGIEAKIVERKKYEQELKTAKRQRIKLGKMIKASGAFFVEP